MSENSVDFTAPLRRLMTQAEIQSFRQLSQMSGVPTSQILKLRRGNLERIPFGSFVALSQVLNVTMNQILALFGAISTEGTSGEGGPLQRWQREGLDCLESLILQLPTATVAAQNNPTAPAVRLLPLLKPIDTLLERWDVTPIGQVGDTVEFDPQQHQWMGASDVPGTGAPVKVSHVGYWHGDRLLHRAKVKPLS